MYCTVLIIIIIIMPETNCKIELKTNLKYLHILSSCDVFLYFNK